jgi:hypothetical protein
MNAISDAVTVFSATVGKKKKRKTDIPALKNGNRYGMKFIKDTEADISTYQEANLSVIQIFLNLRSI